MSILKTQVDSKGAELEELETLKSDFAALRDIQTRTQSLEIEALSTQATQLHSTIDQRDC